MSTVASLPEHDRVPQLTAEHLPRGKLTVAVFGPGHGEAVLVGLPDGRLGVLDGCAEQGDPVRELLGQLDLEDGPPRRLAFMGLTHPHDDHFAGLGQLMNERFQQVDLWLDTPLGLKHAAALQKLLGAVEYPAKPLRKAESLGRIVEVMERVVRTEPARFREPRSDRLLASTRWGGHELRLTAIGPADSDIRRSQLELARALLSTAKGKSRRGGLDPNFQSAAFVLRWGQAGVLLTGDLLNPKHRFLGWSAAVETRALSDGPVQVIKCAHHASEGAHYPGLWDLLQPKLALVTPFKYGLIDSQGAKMPPQPGPLGRIAEQCPVVLTTPPRWLVDAADPSGLGLRNEALPLTPAPGRAAKRNAVAVSLNPDGSIHRVTLAGQAEFFTPRAASRRGPRGPAAGRLG